MLHNWECMGKGTVSFVTGDSELIELSLVVSFRCSAAHVSTLLSCNTTILCICFRNLREDVMVSSSKNRNIREDIR